jgi:hypothetical protein
MKLPILLGLVFLVALGLAFGVVVSQQRTIQLGNVAAIKNPTSTMREVATATTTIATTTINTTTTPALETSTLTASTTPKKNLVSVVAPVAPTPLPIITPIVPTTTISAPSDGLPPVIAIDPETIVGILCYYNMTLTNQEAGISVSSTEQQEIKGSGVIYDSKGDILTNRHIVEQPRSFTTISDNNGSAIYIAIDYTLDRCEVGQLPAGSHLPTASEIQTLNPYVQIPVLGYTAKPFYISDTTGLSNNEIENADFALLKITGVSKTGPTFGVTSVPSSFPFIKLLAVKPYAMNGESVVTYGFPGNVSQGQGNFFETLTMTGSVGHITSIDYGDKYYASTPLTIHTNMEIAHGRSGSPMFWRGYVIGLVFRFFGDSVLDSGSVASDAILKAIR